MEELDKILKEDEPAEEEQKPDPASPKEKKSTEDPLAKERQELENLRKAKLEAQEELKKLREQKKSVKTEEIPKIDFDDPGSKAWDKHIKEQVTPVQRELEEERQEKLNYALDEFLDDNPDLATDKDKLKETLDIYNRLNPARTVEGMKANLKKAYAAVDPEALVMRMREKRGDRVRSDMNFSRAAISRGASSMQTDKEPMPSDILDKEERESVIRMYGSIEEYNKAVKKAK